MPAWIVTGIDTDVGKTLVSSILTEMLCGEYWKPIEAGGRDTETVQGWIECPIHPPAYRFQNPLSPHHAAALEGREIEEAYLQLPKTDSPLIVEGVGGILAPLRQDLLFGDLLLEWNAPCVVVVRFYLGSLNHTLLTLSWLKEREIPIAGLIFNGKAYPEGEELLLRYSSLPCLGKISWEPYLNRRKIQWYAKQFLPLWEEIFNLSGTPLSNG
ncbi:MAG: ATP-dependent dethiobiotin synthetase BioD 1 [Chlamydiae bacterium]|nr:ATP-dependent dethiobiotin synthetase BioD 1 [Chlamydiota bacterium]